MSEKFGETLGCVFAIAFFGFSLLQVAAGWAGLAHSFGWGWALAAALGFFFFRFSLPMVVGAFLCAKDIWGWHWAGALLFAAPGLLLMVPSFFAALVSAVKR